MADLLVLPIAISHIEGRYLVFDINAITYLREHYRICGVFIGTLPQNPSQNVFMGLPMEIMPEEAQTLIDEAICFILDDAYAHDIALAEANRRRQRTYVKEHESRALEIAEEKAREKEFEKRKALKKVKAKQGIESMRSSTETVTPSTEETQRPLPASDSTAQSESLFESPSDQTSTNPTQAQPNLTITPASSSVLVSYDPPEKPIRRIPGLNTSSYNLYKHLNSKSYFQTPGLRFGCQFCVYPGDPLRFHSHFLAVGYEWDEEIDLMDVVGGGRLGTGVKKGWLVGGKEPNRQGVEGKMRTWSVEWAGM